MENYSLANINFSEVSEKPVIYQIKNTLNGKVFILSASNFRKHLKALVTSLEKSLDRNPKELNRDYHNYGKEFFKVEVLRTQGLTKDNMVSIKDKLLNVATRLYNLKTDSNAGGYELLSEPCYLLNLDGSIHSEYKSIQGAFKFLKITPHYGGKNTPSVVGNKYRIVTKEFYENNTIEISTWPHYTDLSKYMSEVYKKSIMVSAKIGKKVKVFEDSGALADELKKTREAIRLILKGETKSNPYEIKYVNEDAIIEFKHLKELKEFQRKENKKKREAI